MGAPLRHHHALALGAIIIMQWPVSSLYVLGIFLGVDLIIAGSSWLAAALAFRRSREHATVTLSGNRRSACHRG